MLAMETVEELVVGPTSTATGLIQQRHARYGIAVSWLAKFYWTGFIRLSPRALITESQPGHLF